MYVCEENVRLFDRCVCVFARWRSQTCLKTYVENRQAAAIDMVVAMMMMMIAVLGGRGIAWGTRALLHYIYKCAYVPMCTDVS